jgi:hypothetical protein
MRLLVPAVAVAQEGRNIQVFATAKARVCAQGRALWLLLALWLLALWLLAFWLLAFWLLAFWLWCLILLRS